MIKCVYNYFFSEFGRQLEACLSWYVVVLFIVIAFVMIAGSKELLCLFAFVSSLVTL